MAFVLQQLINALALGSIYALMAIGLAIIFGILRLINFAHGELLMIGPYLVLVLSLAPVAMSLSSRSTHRARSSPTMRDCS